MRRRHRLHQQGREHLDRWLVSYADYMTLIFALFVVLYSVAMVNKEKYHGILESLTQAFSQTAPARDGLLEGSTGLLDSAELPPESASMVVSEPPATMITGKRDGASLASIDAALIKALTGIAESGQVKVNRDDEWLTIELNSGMLFASGSATLSGQADGVLKAVTDVVSPVNNYVRVRGYTDNQQIRNELFRSNWQLSAARASAVLDALMAHGIDPHRLAMEAYGEFSPWADNGSEAGRAQNRKVVIALSRYGWTPAPPASPPVEEAVTTPSPAPSTATGSSDIKTITLPQGGIRITTRQD